jgi:nucleoid-associated protein YgaU
MIITCPVCETQNEGNKRCKQCSTDLTPLIRVVELPSGYYRNGLKFLNQCNLDEAQIALSTAAALDPDSTDIQAALANLNARKNQGKAAKNIRQRRLLWALPITAFLLGLASLAIIQAVPRWMAPPPDWSSRVRQRLEGHPATQVFSLRVTEKAGVVKVAGEVPSELHVHLIRELAETAAEGHVAFSDLKLTPSPPATPPTVYRVRSGDSLWLIAQRQYGNAALWPQIEIANRIRLHGSKMLSVGDSLVLPPITIQPR